MKITRLEKVLALGLVIIFIFSSFSAAILWTRLNESPEIYEIPDETEEILGVGEKSLKQEFIFSDPVINESREYANVYVNESDFNSSADGRPILPVNLTIIELPFGTEIINISFYNSTPEIITLSKKLSFGSCSTRPSMDKNIYNKIDPYPQDFVSYRTGGGLSNGVHKTFLVIRVYPIIYIPWNNQLQFIKDIKIKIIYKEPFRPLLKDNQVYDLLIISPSRFTNLLQPLVNHKNQHDIRTKIVSLEEVYNRGWYGRDKEEKIKYFIKDAIENWGIKYVLLVGGMKGQGFSWELPARYSHVLIRKGTQEELEPAFISDLYYADIYDSEGHFSSWDTNKNGIFAEWDENNKDEMDLYPDVYLGRLPCTNKIDVRTMVKKIINYEKDKCDESWFKKMVLITGDHWNDENHINEGELITEEALNLMPGFEPVKVYASEKTIDYKTINNALNPGAGFAYFVGHGTAILWTTHYPPDGTKWTGMYEVKHMNLLKNKMKLPIIVIGGCNNAQFDISIMKKIKEGIKKSGLRYFSPNPLKTGTFWKSGRWFAKCFAWKLTSKNGGGSIATIGNTALGTHAMNDADNNSKNDYLEIYDGWLELRFFQLYGEEHKDILGEVYGEAITDYLSRFLGNNDEMDIKMAQEWELFGDPSLKICGYDLKK
jgi:hypothetical protein